MSVRVRVRVVNVFQNKGSAAETHVQSYCLAASAIPQS